MTSTHHTDPEANMADVLTATGITTTGIITFTNADIITFADCYHGDSIYGTEDLDEAVILNVRYLPGSRREIKVRYNEYLGDPIEFKVTGKDARPFMAAVRSVYDRRVAAEA